MKYIVNYISTLDIYIFLDNKNVIKIQINHGFYYLCIVIHKRRIE